jgi:hypothetical protein
MYEPQHNWERHVLGELGQAHTWKNRMTGRDAMYSGVHSRLNRNQAWTRTPSLASNQTSWRGCGAVGCGGCTPACPTNTAKVQMCMSWLACNRTCPGAAVREQGSKALACQHEKPRLHTPSKGPRCADTSLRYELPADSVSLSAAAMSQRTCRHGMQLDNLRCLACLKHTAPRSLGGPDPCLCAIGTLVSYPTLPAYANLGLQGSVIGLSLSSVHDRVPHLVT